MSLKGYNHAFCVRGFRGTEAISSNNLYSQEKGFQGSTLELQAPNSALLLPLSPSQLLWPCCAWCRSCACVFLWTPPVQNIAPLLNILLLRRSRCGANKPSRKKSSRKPQGDVPGGQVAHSIGLIHWYCISCWWFPAKSHWVIQDLKQGTCERHRNTRRCFRVPPMLLTWITCP